MSPTIKLNPSTSLLNGCCLTVYCVHRWEWECVCIISDQGHPPPPQCRDHNNIGTMDVADSDKRHRHHQLHLRSVHTYFACYFCILSNGSWNIRQQICFRGYCLSGNFLIRFISLHQQGRQRDWARWESRIFLFSDGLGERESWEHRRLTDGIHSSHIWTLGLLSTSGGVVGAVL